MRASPDSRAQYCASQEKHARVGSDGDLLVNEWYIYHLFDSPREWYGMSREFGPGTNFVEFISKSAGAERLRKF